MGMSRCWSKHAKRDHRSSLISREHHASFFFVCCGEHFASYHPTYLLSGVLHQVFVACVLQLRPDALVLPEFRRRLVMVARAVVGADEWPQEICSRQLSGEPEEDKTERHQAGHTIKEAIVGLECAWNADVVQPIIIIITITPSHRHIVAYALLREPDILPTRCWRACCGQRTQHTTKNGTHMIWCAWTRSARILHSTLPLRHACTDVGWLIGDRRWRRVRCDKWINEYGFAYIWTSCQWYSHSAVMTVALRFRNSFCSSELSDICLCIMFLITDIILMLSHFQCSYYIREFPGYKTGFVYVFMSTQWTKLSNHYIVAKEIKIRNINNKQNKKCVLCNALHTLKT